MFASSAPLDEDVRRAYLVRLGIEPEPPSIEALSRLVERHAERVPYETMWIHAGEQWSIDPHHAAARIALHRRGGYCYHLNGALGLLLTSLGYAVRGHVGGVHGPEGPNPAAAGNHFVLTVTLPPDERSPDGQWYVDNGLGDALHEPLPLVAGPYRQAPFDLNLEQDAGWHLTHDPNGGFTGMSWTMSDAHRTDFEAQHQWLSTSPESGFVQVAMAERRDAEGVDVVRGLVPIRVGSGASTGEPVTKKAEWFDLLGDRFDLNIPAERRQRLWETVSAAHRRWEDRQDDT